MNKYELMWVALFINAQKQVKAYQETNFDDPNYEERSDSAAKARIVIENMCEIEKEVESWKK